MVGSAIAVSAVDGIEPFVKFNFYRDFGKVAGRPLPGRNVLVSKLEIDLSTAMENRPLITPWLWRHSLQGWGAVSRSRFIGYPVHVRSRSWGC